MALAVVRPTRVFGTRAGCSGIGRAYLAPMRAALVWNTSLSTRTYKKAGNVDSAAESLGSISGCAASSSPSSNINYSRPKKSASVARVPCWVSKRRMSGTDTRMFKSALIMPAWMNGYVLARCAADGGTLSVASPAREDGFSVRGLTGKEGDLVGHERAPSLNIK